VFPKPDGWTRGPLAADSAMLTIQSDYHNAHVISVAVRKGEGGKAGGLDGDVVQHPTQVRANGLELTVQEVTQEASPGVHAHMRIATLQDGEDLYMFLLVTSRPRRDEDADDFDFLIRNIRRVR